MCRDVSDSEVKCKPSIEVEEWGVWLSDACLAYMRPCFNPQPKQGRTATDRCLGTMAGQVTGGKAFKYPL